MSSVDPRLALAFVLALAGCTLGLAPTIGDRDGDGVPDERDDCPGDYDPGQQDLDGDGLGDACGPCHVLTHDFDHDGRDDACDGCVGPGPVGQDLDGDGIDDGCDPCVSGVGQTGMDADHDGIDDGCDSCIESGLDRDHDGIDDACDACLLGPPHDEDGDGTADSCDDCPADPDPGQDRSSDDIGIACDPDPNRNDTRRLFDSFAVDLDTVWNPSVNWMSIGDAIRPSPSGLQRRSSFFEVRHDLTVRTRVRFDTSNAAGSVLGVSLSGNGGTLAVTYDCGVRFDGTVTMSGTVAPNKVDPSQVLELRVVRTQLPDLTYSVSCQAIDHNGTTGQVTLVTGIGVDLTISLTSNNARGTFQWLDAIDHVAN